MGAALLAAVLNGPTVSMRSQRNGELHVLQAVIVKPDASAEVPLDLCILLRATVSPQTFLAGARVPASVIGANVTVTLCDLEDSQECLGLVRTLTQWSAEHPLPNESSRRGIETVAFLGDPSRLCVGDVPLDWRARLEDITKAFDRSTAIVGDGARFSGDLPANTTTAIVFDPYSGHAPRSPDGLILTEIDSRSLTYVELEAAVVGLIAEAVDNDIEPAPTQVALTAGQRIYHRKVGNSRHYDKFDAGSDKPCLHGERAFVAWSGDKCIKGFRRRYSNFEPSMIRHCGKYPGCNVYAVFA